MQFWSSSDNSTGGQQTMSHNSSTSHHSLPPITYRMVRTELVQSIDHRSCRSPIKPTIRQTNQELHWVSRRLISSRCQSHRTHLIYLINHWGHWSRLFQPLMHDFPSKRQGSHKSLAGTSTSLRPIRSSQTSHQCQKVRMY